MTKLSYGPGGKRLPEGDSLVHAVVSDKPNVLMLPDYMDYDNLAPARTRRGRVVRGFFWIMRWWPT